jgi:sec-independent protein translocase protein TatA
MDYTGNILAWSLPGGSEWIIILVIALLIFGKRLPDIARSVGKSLSSFKKGLKDVEDDIDSDVQDSDKKKFENKQKDPE